MSASGPSYPGAAFVAVRVGYSPVSIPVGCTLMLGSGVRLALSALPAPEWLAALARQGESLMHPGWGVDQVFLCREPVDFRKAIGGLSVLIEQELA